MLAQLAAPGHALPGSVDTDSAWWGLVLSLLDDNRLSDTDSVAAMAFRRPI